MKQIFGNWNVSEDGIRWAASGIQRFVIPAEELNRTRKTGTDGAVFYDWILLATDEDWLTENDLYDLNYAFVFAIARSGLYFDYEVFDATLALQFEQFEAEEDEDAS